MPHFNIYKMRILISGLFCSIILFSCKGKSSNDEAVSNIKAAAAKNVSTYNELEADKAKAVQEGDSATAVVLQASMDSIMIANAQLGDSLIRMRPAE